jgi:hypothetical protein
MTLPQESHSLSGFVYEFWKGLPQNSTVRESLTRRTEAFTGGTVDSNQDNTFLSAFPPGAEYVVQMDVEPGVLCTEFSLCYSSDNKEITKLV